MGTDYLVEARQHNAWQQPVEDKDLETSPSVSKGARYIIAGTGGDWSVGTINDVAQYNGAIWDFATPLEGWIVYVKDEDKYYRFDGSNWVEYIGPTGPTGPQGATGVGDMEKSIYDTDDDGIVDKAENVDDGAGNASTAADVKDAVDKKHTQGTDTTLGTLTAGISFPATTVPSEDANTLDDYEEGAWTMGISFGGGTTGITYALNTGEYIKIGNLVIVTGYLSLSSKGSSNGNAWLTGLPFTIGASYSVGAGYLEFTSFADWPIFLAPINKTYLELREITNAGAISFLTDADFADNSGIIISLSYFL